MLVQWFDEGWQLGVIESYKAKDKLYFGGLKEGSSGDGASRDVFFIFSICSPRSSA